MLEQVLDHIHNFFVKDVYSGEVRISSGSVDLSFLKEGQRFKIVGSDLNDGVYTYYTDGIKDSDGVSTVSLKDEDFRGEVWAMAVPPSVIALSDEIREWVAKYGDVINNPYSSESFGGYSYSKSQASTGAGGVSQFSWQFVFRSRLNVWRKLA